ncbi:hypothetical protein U0070_019562 [Myodes glareolus]|uniref:Uncharacterized protein n=1 Tax=Myodes glareolus TaxID=447135 RepID=A0AAW0JMG4_MYOGA
MNRVWPVPSTEIYRHLACSRALCSSAQCRVSRPVGCAALLETDGSSLGRQITTSAPPGAPYFLQPPGGCPLSLERMLGIVSSSLLSMSALLALQEVTGTGALPGVCGPQRTREWTAGPPLKVKLGTAHSQHPETDFFF